MTSFENLGLSQELLRALADLGFEKPSAIQEQAIPQLIDNYRDFIGLAQTGTGKTAAFGLPLLEKIDPEDKSTQALILAPTRELGQQIAEQLSLFSKYMPRVNVLSVYGGANISTQIKDLRKPQQVIIATPGRLLDLIQRKAIKLHEIKMLVLDEADEMLNMGFKEDLDQILSHTPDEKITWLFSATMPKEIKKIVNTYMYQPIEVKVNTGNEVNTDIDHQFAVVRQSDKDEALTRFLDLNPDMRGVVFCRTKRDTQNLAEYLLKLGYKADALHGDLSQPQRDRVMKRFKTHELQVLIATDVAARGIDVTDLTHVIHHTMPDDASYYTHRSGRTARAGKKGISLALVNFKEKGRVFRFEKSLGINFTKVDVPQVDEITAYRMRNWAQQVLETPVKNKLDPAIFQELDILLSGLSREELLAKIMVKEMLTLNLAQGRDLNDKGAPGGGRSGGKRKRTGGGSGRQGGGGKPGNFKKRFQSEGGRGGGKKFKGKRGNFKGNKKK